MAVAAGSGLVALTGQGLVERVERDIQSLRVVLGNFEQRVRQFSETTELAERGSFTLHTRTPAVPVGLFVAGEVVVAAFHLPGVDNPEVGDLLRVYQREGRGLRLLPNPFAHHKALGRWLSDLYLSHRGRVQFSEVIPTPVGVLLAFDILHGEGQPPRRHLLGLDLSEGISEVKLVRNPVLPELPVADFVGISTIDQARWQPATRTNAYYHHTQAGPLYVFVEWGTLKIRDRLEVPRGAADLAIDGAADREQSVNPFLTSWLGTHDDAGEVLLKVEPSSGRPLLYIYYSPHPRRFQRVDFSAMEGLDLPGKLGRITSMFLQAGGETTFLGGLPARPLLSLESPGGRDRLYAFQRVDNLITLHTFDVDSRQVRRSFRDIISFTVLPDGHLVMLKGPADGQITPALEHPTEVWITPFRHQTGDLSAEQERYLRSFSTDAMDALIEGTRVLSRQVDAQDYHVARDHLDQLLITFPFVERVPEVRAAISRLHEGLSRCVAVEEELGEIHQRRRDTLAFLQKEEDTLTQHLSGEPPTQLAQLLKVVDSYRTLSGSLEQSAAEPNLPPDVVEGQKGLRRKFTEILLTWSERGARQVERELETLEIQLGEIEEEVPRQTALPEVEHALGRIQIMRATLTTMMENLRLLDLPPQRSLKLAEQATGAVVTGDRVEAALRLRRRDLSRKERQESFGAWLLQLDLQIATEPALASQVEQCDGRLGALLAEVESRKADYADFPELIERLEERAARAQTRFEARKVELLRQRDEADGELTARFRLRMTALQVAARGVDLSPTALEGWLAGHPERIQCQHIIEELRRLGLVGRAGALQGQLDQLRRLLVSERQEAAIFVIEGERLQLGGVHLHRNRLQLQLQEVVVGEGIGLALSGTGLVLTPQQLGDVDIPSGYRGQLAETAEVSRAEVLAWRVLSQVEASGKLTELSREAAGEGGITHLEVHTREMALRHVEEGFTLGQHDRDAARILKGVLPVWVRLGLLKWPPRVRVEAAQAWSRVIDGPRVAAAAKGVLNLGQLFGGGSGCRQVLGAALGDCPPAWLDYLEAELKGGGLAEGGQMVAHPRALTLAQQMVTMVGADVLQEALKPFASAITRWEVLLPEVERLLQREGEVDQPLAVEVAWLLATVDGGEIRKGGRVSSTTRVTIPGLSGDHVRTQGPLVLDLPEWRLSMDHFLREQMPRFRALRQALEVRKQTLAAQWDLPALSPRPLARFAWTRLLRRVYLPLVARALEKQLGSLDRPGEDQMGVLLLVSPPGYGKTELLKKVASLLGYAFVSISGTALGKTTTSLDPSAAADDNAAAALRRLLLGLSLQENVLLDIEDIQACSDMFLEKLLPLCDASRTVEVVVEGSARLINLQGKRVAVVMTLNPLRAQVPQALSNRATLINLGDVADKHAADFAMSYLEVAAAANTTLEVVSTLRDLETFATALELGRPVSTLEADLNGRYAAVELTRIEVVLRHCMAVRDVLMAVNRSCLHSATLEDMYRVEPPFELQGSYRDMVEICRSIEADWTEEMRRDAILRHYEGQAGLLGPRGEYNLLMVKTFLGHVSEAERERQAHIRYVFRLAQQRDQTMLTLLDRLTEVSAAVERIPASVVSHGEGLADRLVRELANLATLYLDGNDRKIKTWDNLPERIGEVYTQPLKMALEGVGGQLSLPLENIRQGLEELPSALATQWNPSLAELNQGIQKLSGSLAQEITPIRGAAEKIAAELESSLAGLSHTVGHLSGELNQDAQHRMAARHNFWLSVMRRLLGVDLGTEPGASVPHPPESPVQVAPPAEEVVSDPPSSRFGEWFAAYGEQLMRGDEAAAPQLSLWEVGAISSYPSPPTAGTEPKKSAPPKHDDISNTAPGSAPTSPEQDKPNTLVDGPILLDLLASTLRQISFDVSLRQGDPPPWAGELAGVLTAIRDDLRRLAAASERPRPDVLSSLKSALMAIPDPPAR